MNADPVDAPAPVSVAVLHLAASDPRCALRLPEPMPFPLRISLVAQLAARGGSTLDGGSGLSCFFGSGVQAVQAAIEILGNGTALLADEGTPTALRAIVVELAKPGDAGRGEALSHATRLASFSRDHTLLLTRGLYTLLDSPLSERTRLAVAPAVADGHPGLPGLADLFELDWRGAVQRLSQVTGTPMLGDLPRSSEELELSHGGREMKLKAADCPFTLGRDKSCAMKLDGDVASRVHARIEFSHDKFYFVDDSRNGTYLLTPQGEEVFLHHERLPLLGRGVISPGAPIVKQTGEVVRYACRTAAAFDAASVLPDPEPAIAA